MAPLSIDAAELQLHSFRGGETSAALHTTLTSLLGQLSGLVTTTTPPLAVSVPREIIAYVEDGRNPDIYTREFVELVQRQNQYVKGKADAFAAFRDVLAEEISSALPALKLDVDRVLRETRAREDDDGDEDKDEKTSQLHVAATTTTAAAAATTTTAGDATIPRMNDLR
ncbi:MAG: RNA polymerase II mediator complex subunit [Trichoglossum hirsutum]|nr:MAG: RNA polymerase II mediator complex subunit [Trichoglossum hirsutum]